MKNTPPKSVGFEIQQVAILLKRCFTNTVCEKESPNSYDLTIIQSHIIGTIYQHDNFTIPQSELEKEFSRRRSTITGILKLMEKNGLITREYSKKDARVKLVTLTDKAISLQKKIIKRIDSFNQNLENGLTSEEIQTFYSIMDKIRKNLE